MRFLRSQNDILNGGISLHDQFPVSGTDFHFPTIKTADCRVFKMATGCSKWLPAVLGDRFLAILAPKMATVWRIFTGRWVFSPLERIELFWMCFNWFFNFALRCFRLTAIFLEWVIVVKQGTTVLWRAVCRSFADYIPNLVGIPNLAPFLKGKDSCEEK